MHSFEQIEWVRLVGTEPVVDDGVEDDADTDDGQHGLNDGLNDDLKEAIINLEKAKRLNPNKPNITPVKTN